MGFIKRKDVSDYVTYTRRFEGYKWFKPVLEALLALVFTFIGTIICLIISGMILLFEGGDVIQFMYGLKDLYNNFDSYSLHGAIATLGNVACMVPAVLLAVKLVKGRPVNSVLSSCGGFSFRIFAKTLISAALLIGVPVAVQVFIIAQKTPVKFSVPGFVACMLLGPLQCVGEEMMLRGVCLQGFGSWFKKTFIAILAQTVIFALLHSYSLLGLIEVGVFGFAMGFIVYYTKGLEAASAAHIMNNMTLFILNGFGLKTISSNGAEIIDIILSLTINLIYTGFLILMDKKFNWFERAPKQTDIQA